MPSDPIVPRVIRRHLGGPSESEAFVEDAVARQAELLSTLLACSREIDHLQWQTREALDSEKDPKNALARIASRRRAVLATETDAEIRLRDMAAQARGLCRRVKRERTLDMHDVVRTLERIVRAAGIDE